MIRKMSEIIDYFSNPPHIGNCSKAAHGITHNSRNINPGMIFVAIKGDSVDGHDFIHKAISQGAVGIIAEQPSMDEKDEICWIRVPNSRSILGKASAFVYDYPSKKMNLVGITGTNGKTTLTYLLEAIAKAAKRIPGVIGTINYRWCGSETNASNTTPEASDVQQILSSMLQSGVTDVFMEVSSHGLHKKRLDGCDFNLGVFTNLTQDHLDYHGSLEDYYLAKKLLFSELLASSTKPEPAAIINIDDSYGKRLKSELSDLATVSFGMDMNADYHPMDLSIDGYGIRGTLQIPGKVLTIESSLTGMFNVSNILAAVATANQMGMASESIIGGIRNASIIPGRLEKIPSAKGLIFVDYAHTPNALKNVLDCLRPMRDTRIITIMGCGGDRDKTKRPLMGKEAGLGSDIVIITSDNPRSEDPIEIIDQIESGLRQIGVHSHINGHPLDSTNKVYTKIPDRKQAIGWALSQLGDGDILLVAGKGHETYQEIQGIKYDFDDRKVIREKLSELDLNR
jgi:UDP-N-acetylmuramoyl-L-alanyl-D-glutamate--2,6-diaminopimelate ligase